MKKKFLAVFAALTVLNPVFAEKTVEEIITIFTDNDRVPDFNFSVLACDNINPDGKVEHMIINQYGSGVGKDLKNVVFDFKSPSTVKNTRVLQAQKVGRNDDRWIYVPALKQVRRIPMSDRYKSFVGTEFTYNDMTIRELSEDKSEMMSASEDITVGNGKYNCWKIKSTPYKTADVEYGYRISWFDKKTYVPVRIEFYDKKDASKMIKLYEVEKLEMVKGSTGIEYPLRRQNLTTNLINGRKTRITVKEFVFDTPISDGYFTQSWLQTGKTK